MVSKEWGSDWQRRIQEVMREAGADEKPCPVCEGAQHFALPFVAAPWLEEPGPPYPAEGCFLLPLVCVGCGHMRFFGAGPLSMAAERKSKRPNL